MLVGVLVACEILFWVVLGAGLAARYVLRRRVLSNVLLVGAPLVDLILLVATGADLSGGGRATTAHTLAAVYIGVSVGFGHRTVAWADARFAHRFAGGPAPTPRPRYGAAHAAGQRADWLRHLAAYAVGVGLMMLAVLVIDDADRTRAFLDTATLWSLILVIDGLISFSYTFFPRHPKVDERDRELVR